MSKILFVDDSRTIVALYKRLFEISGYEVLTAMDGEAALKLALEEKPDLIILDGVLPKLNGFDVCRKLRLDPGMKSAKVMMFTGGAEGQESRQAKEAGADQYLSKEAGPPEVVDAVRRILAHPA